MGQDESRRLSLAAAEGVSARRLGVAAAYEQAGPRFALSDRSGPAGRSQNCSSASSPTESGWPSPA